MDKTVFVVGMDRQVEHMFRLRDFELTDDPRTATVLCFTGGADVSPILYGEKPLHGKYYGDPDRDAEEVHMLRITDDLRADGKQIAVGICRGGQFLNVMAGGTLWQDVNNHGRTHKAFCHINKRMLSVTSTHHQMMRPSFRGRVLMSASESNEKFSDGIQWLAKVPPELEDTEAVWYEDQRFLCFQPHPEYGGAPACTDLFFEYIDKFGNT